MLIIIEATRNTPSPMLRARFLNESYPCLVLNPELGCVKRICYHYTTFLSLREAAIHWGKTNIFFPTETNAKATQLIQCAKLQFGFKKLDTMTYVLSPTSSGVFIKSYNFVLKKNQHGRCFQSFAVQTSGFSLWTWGILPSWTHAYATNQQLP